MTVELKTPGIEEYEDILELWDGAGLPYKPEGRDTIENIEKIRFTRRFKINHLKPGTF